MTSGYGSVREKKVNPDLAEERSLKDFDQGELTRLIYGSNFERHLEYKDMLEKHPIMQSKMEMYDMTREEQMERSMKIFNYIVKNPDLVKLHQAKSLHTGFSDYLQGQVRVMHHYIASILVPLRNQSLHVLDDNPEPWHGRAG